MHESEIPIRWFLSLSEQISIMKKALLILTGICATLGVMAQPGVGSISFLGFQADSPDAFAFVTLEDFATGDSILFTDNGWSGTTFFANENTMSWKATSSVAAGTVITITDPNDNGVPNALINGPGTTRGKLTGFAVSGDQLFAYIINSGGTQIPIAGFSTNGFLATCNTTGIGNSNTSCLPSTLTLGQTAIQLTAQSPGASNPDNAFVTINPIAGTPEEILSIINNPLNWSAGEDPALTGAAVWPAWTVNIGATDPSVVSFNVAAVSIIEGSVPVEVLLSIEPPLNLPKNISIQVQLSTEVTAEDFNSTPAHVNGLIQLTIPAGVSAYSFFVQAPAGDAVEGNELSTMSITAVDPGVVIGAANTINFAIEEDLNSSFISFASNQTEITLTEGESTALVLNWSPENLSESSFVVEISYGSGATEGDISTDPTIQSSQISVTVPAGQSSVSIDLTATDDNLVEPTENITLTLSGFQGNFNPGQFTTMNLTIIDNDVPANQPALFINELMASNSITYSDEVGDYDDWIEIYNGGTEAVDLAGYFITNEASFPDKYQFPTGLAETLIPPGGFKVIWADDSLQEGPLHVNFTLDNTGGFVGLYMLAGDEQQFYSAIDSISYGNLGTDISFGRITDGGLPWIVIGSSPGVSNETVGLEVVQSGRLLAYPNPVSDHLRLRFDSTEPAIIRLNSLEGKTLLEQQSAELETQLNMSAIPAGFYILDVVQGQRRIAVKLTVIH
jgi:hypothetical protein